MEVFDITDPRFHEQIAPVPCHFVKSWFHCILHVLMLHVIQYQRVFEHWLNSFVILIRYSVYRLRVCSVRWIQNRILDLRTEFAFLSALNPNPDFWSGESFLKKDSLDLKSEGCTMKLKPIILTFWVINVRQITTLIVGSAWNDKVVILFILSTYKSNGTIFCWETRYLFHNTDIRVQLNKTFTSAIYRCTHCFRVRKQ